VQFRVFHRATASERVEEEIAWMRSGTRYFGRSCAGATVDRGGLLVLARRHLRWTSHRLWKVCVGVGGSERSERTPWNVLYIPKP
jgi:hypothetical protein